MLLFCWNQVLNLEIILSNSCIGRYFEGVKLYSIPLPVTSIKCTIQSYLVSFPLPVHILLSLLHALPFPVHLSWPFLPFSSPLASISCLSPLHPSPFSFSPASSVHPTCLFPFLTLPALCCCGCCSVACSPPRSLELMQSFKSGMCTPENYI